MTVFGLCSLKSDGVTTAALTLAHVWPSARPVAVADCDPRGGDVAARLRLSEERGLRSLAARARRDDPVTAIRDELVLAGEVAVLAAPASARACSAALARLADGLVPALATLPGDTLVDCGGLFPGTPARALLAQMDRVLLVTRASSWALDRAHTDARVALGDDVEPELLMVGERALLGADRGNHDPDEAESDLMFPVVGVLADDPRGARRVGTAWWFNWSHLAKTARSVAAALCAERPADVPHAEQAGTAR